MWRRWITKVKGQPLTNGIHQETQPTFRWLRKNLIRGLGFPHGKMAIGRLMKSLRGRTVIFRVLILWLKFLRGWVEKQLSKALLQRIVFWLVGPHIYIHYIHADMCWDTLSMDFLSIFDGVALPSLAQYGIQLFSKWQGNWMITTINEVRVK